MKESEGVFKEIVQSIEEGVIYVDLKGIVLFANETLALITGIPMDELTGKNAINIARKFISKKDIPFILKKIQKALTGASLKPFEIQFNNKHLEIRVNYNKKTRKIVGLFQDISDKMNVETKLKESEQHLRSIINAIPDLLFTITKKGIITEYKADLNDLYYQDDSIIGKNIHSVLPEELAKKTYDLIQKTLKTNKIQEYEYTLDIPGKGLCFYEAKMAPKNEMEVVTIVRDITEKKLIDKKIEENEELLRVTNEFVNDIIWRLDTKANFTYVSPSAKKLLGYSPDEIIGKNVLSIVKEDEHKKAKDVIKQRLQNNYSDHYDFHLLSKDGRYIPFDINSAPIIDSNNNVVGISGVSRDISEKKKTEERFRLIVERSHDIFYFQDINTKKHTYVSPKVKDILGYTVEEFLEFDLNEQKSKIHPDDLPYLLNFANELINADKLGKASINRTFRLKNKNGRYLWIEGNYSLIKNDKGEPHLIVGSLHDITERKQAEIKLTENEKRFKTIFNQAAIGIALVKPDGVFMQVNEKFKEITGYTDKEITKLNFRDISHPEDLDADLKQVEKVLSGKMDSYSIEKRYIHKKGHPVWVKMHSNVIREHNGKVEYAIAAIEDITEIKKTEEELSQSEYRYKSLVNNSPDGIFIVQDGNIVYANQAVLSITGYKFKEVLNKEFLQHIHPEDKAEVTVNYVNRLKGIITPPYDFRIQRKEGSYFWVSLNASVIDWNGKEAVLCFATNINDKKIIENKLIESEEKYRKLFEESSDPVLLIDYDTFVECNQATIDFLGYTSTKDIVGKKPWEISPENQPDKLKSKEKALSVIHETMDKGKARFEWVHLDKNGNEKYIDISLTKIPGKYKNQIYTVWKDISNIKRQQKIQKAMNAISGSVNTTSDLEELAKIIQDQLGEIIDTTNFSLCTYDPLNDTLPFIFKKNQKDTYKRFELGKTLTNYVIKSGKTLLGSQKVQNKLIKQGKVELVGNPAKVWIGVPLKIEDKVIGIITVQSYKSEDAYSKDDIKLLEHISNHIAIAIKKKEAEEELIKRNNFIQTVLDNLPIGVALNEIDKGHATYINKKFEEIYGWPENELKDISNFFKKVYPDEAYRKEISEMVMKDIESGDLEKMHWENIRVTTANSGEKRVNSVNIPLFDQNTMVSTVMDVTKQKMLEEELRKNKDQLQGLFDHMTSSFAYHKIILDNEGKPIDYEFIEVNKAFVNELGITREQLIGKRVTKVIPGTENDPADWIGTYGKVALTGESIEFEQFSRGIGKWFHIKAYSPEKYFFATTFTDITIRKKNEEELQKHREKLEELVKERTQELEEKNERLERMNKLFVDREFRIKELRVKVEELKNKLNEEV